MAIILRSRGFGVTPSPLIHTRLVQAKITACPNQHTIISISYQLTLLVLCSRIRSRQRFNSIHNNSPNSRTCNPRRRSLFRKAHESALLSFHHSINNGTLFPLGHCRLDIRSNSNCSLACLSRMKVGGMRQLLRIMPPTAMPATQMSASLTVRPHRQILILGPA